VWNSDMGSRFLAASTGQLRSVRRAYMYSAGAPFAGGGPGLPTEASCIRCASNRPRRWAVCFTIASQVAMSLMFKGVKRASEQIVTRGAGSYVWTNTGAKLLDFTAGIGVLATGHCV